MLNTVTAYQLYLNVVSVEQAEMSLEPLNPFFATFFYIHNPFSLK
jgi:hypothetical protein